MLLRFLYRSNEFTSPGSATITVTRSMSGATARADGLQRITMAWTPAARHKVANGTAVDKARATVCRWQRRIPTVASTKIAGHRAAPRTRITTTSPISVRAPAANPCQWTKYPA